MFASWVAKSSTLYLILVTGQGSASCTAVRIFGARDANISHALGAVWGADAAANIMEAVVALGVPKGAPFLAATALVNLASTATIGVRLVAVGTIVTELRVVRAVLPADWANSTEATLAVGVAEGTILLLIICAGGERLTSGTSIGFLPARVGDIRVVIIMMIVVNWCTIVVLFGMSQRLLRVMSEVRHVLLILIVGVAAFVLHGVLVVSVETTVVVGAIIEVLRVVVSVMMTMLHLVVSIVVIRVVMLSDVLRLVVVAIHG